MIFKQIIISEEINMFEKKRIRKREKNKKQLV